MALSEVKSASYTELFSMRLSEYLSAFERESLLVKTDRLFQLCKPPREFAPVRGYQFDRDRLCGLDRARHDLVHSQSTSALPGDIDAAIEYLVNTGMFLLGLINHRYQVRLDPACLLHPDSPMKPPVV